jgi:hypothetical protein
MPVFKRGIRSFEGHAEFLAILADAAYEEDDDMCHRIARI